MKLDNFLWVADCVNCDYFRIEGDTVHAYIDKNSIAVFEGQNVELISCGKTVFKGRFRSIREESSLMKLLRCLKPESEISGDSNALEIATTDGYRLIIDDKKCRLYDGYCAVATVKRDELNILINFFRF
ncbi:hypothetical protein J5500_00315 [Candidatus Saccharibacteria bacterium]|nr:hypothetical protein [Candidatus Saccharibacteria bacterium]